ncbi:ARM repeat-containing protein [Piromyces finnis]|uniref:ARM repeat-containing protein n=1 Tax=Piromyces finnis TaxID=1754191 RepID=A0A1Y1VCC1_9FUNG|nr:ARM repeat-containing protein [Piromyces finnis]|eukprot:ORX52517.1 ARM repeat-containing protein [Piromyces finnis]
MIKNKYTNDIKNGSNNKNLNKHKCESIQESCLSKYSYSNKNIDSLPPIKPNNSNNSNQTFYFLKLSRTWDKGNRTIRERILRDFIKNNKNKTGPQLERELFYGASLFLTRLTAWLRLTYLLGSDILLLLQAIDIFVSASSGHRFLTEFLEIGGVLTILEILCISQVKEEEKAQVLKILSHIANSGRQYKEFICESYGIRAIADCLARSKSEETQDCAKNLLYQLGVGNPKYLIQVYKALMSILISPSVSVSCQQMSSQALRMLLPSIPVIHPSIVEAISSLLKSNYIQIQYEGYEILVELMKKPNLQDIIIKHLCEILKVVTETIDDNMDESNKKWKESTTEEKVNLSNEENHPLIMNNKDSDTAVHIYMQQSYASKLLGVLAVQSDLLAEKMIDNQIISGLLCVVANVTHPESQKNAANTLIYILDKFPKVKNELRSKMGKNFIDLIDYHPDTFYKELNKEQIIYLKKNKIIIGRNIDNSQPRQRRKSSIIQSNKFFPFNEDNKSKTSNNEKDTKDDNKSEIDKDSEQIDSSSNGESDNNINRKISDEDLISDNESESEFTEPSYDEEEGENDENIDIKKKSAVNTKIYIPPEQIQIHSILSSGKILDYSKDKPYEKFEYNFSEFK